MFDLTTCSDDELLAEIQAMCPSQLRFEIDFDGDTWVPQFTGLDDDIVSWSDEQPDKRMGLLNAYGWIWLKGRSTSGGPWQERRSEVSGADIHRQVLRASTYEVGREVGPDPEDVDPDEVSLVYEEFLKSRKA